MYLFYSLSCIVSLVTLTFLELTLSGVAISTISHPIKEVDVVRLRYLIHDASTGSPTCILFQNEKSRDQGNTSRDHMSVDRLASLWQELPTSLKSWQLVVHVHKGRNFDVPPDRLPLLRCYLAGGLHKDTDLITELHTLVTWLKSVKRLHYKVMTSLNRILWLTVEDILSGEKPILLLFHGLSVSQLLNGIGSVLREENIVEVIDVYGTNQHGRKLAEHFQIFHFPSAIGFNPSYQDKATPILRLEGDIEVNLRRIQVWAVVEASDAEHMKGNDLTEKVSIEQMNDPLVICVYGTWVPNVLHFITAFERSVDTFHQWNVSLQFSLLDVGKNKQQISHYFNSTVLTNLPALAVFYLRGSGHHVTIESNILLNVRPTPWTVYTFVKSILGDALKYHDGNIVQSVPWFKTADVEETPCETVLQNGLDMCLASGNASVAGQLEVLDSTLGISDSTSIVSKHENVIASNPLAQAVKPKRIPPASLGKQVSRTLQLGKIGNIPLVTTNTWNIVQQMALTPRGVYSKISSSTYNHPPLILIVFIQDGCGYCETLKSDFNQLAKSIDFIPSAGMFIVNCTADVSLCQQEDISGYPSVYVYRGFSQPSRCIEVSTRLVAKRIPYHDVLRVTSILEWLSDVSMAAVKFHDSEIANVKEGSVQLVAMLYTQSAARRYFRSLRGGWFPYHCFVSVCERLLGQAVCYASYTQDVGDRTQSDLIVSNITLFRSDGIQATVFSTGRSLSSTLNDHSSSPLHNFHTPHRYDITPTQTCEQDRIKCTDLLVRYVRDHRRPPVMPITSKVFHADEDLLSNLPVMIALAHESNITANSSFYSVFLLVAKKLYNQMVFTTLNVDVYPSWASRFVPVNFWSSTNSNEVVRTFYPRLCIVEGKDHTRAAFYPPIQDDGYFINSNADTYNEERIVEFVKKYLDEPSRFLVRTEHF
ncbi:uncharacterized protein LOC134182164 [Corticium candelabrum]|uniref:uncharacterized protein LOC134182164 n=1 Tax=Corticium candelabrum TaxID=121492 RepID=UPI002E2708F7|nr:uncharacterized protein LOC134182164 [Corticium candelabrum]